MSGESRKLIFVPTYNERENVTPLVKLIGECCPDFDILFCDDNSPDGTGDVLDALAVTNPRLKVIHRTGKLGIGTAHRAGINWAYEHNYKVLVTMDADFTHSPDNIPRLVEQSEMFDVVVGSRYLQERSLEGWNFFRKFLTRLAHVLTTVLLGLKYDSTGAFRLYRLDRIQVEFFDLVKSGSYSFFFESLHLLNFNKFKITEIPISLPPRTYGTSKMSYRDAFKSLSLLFTTFFRTVFHRNEIKLKVQNVNLKEVPK